MTFGSLFAGIGGFDLGFERAGLRCEWQVEIDERCRAVLAKHWPHCLRWDDVRTFPPRDEGFEPVDVICGGFPCQDISNAGRRAGIDGERSGLWSEFARIVCELRPRFVVVENAAALSERGLGRILGDLAESGHDAEWQSYRVSQFGAPHIRERMFILAWRPSDTPKSFRGGVLADAGCESRFFQQPQRRAYQAVIADGGAAVAGARLAGLHDFGQAATGHGAWASEPTVGRVVHGVSDRVGAVSRLGNSVSPVITEWIGRRLIESTTQTI